MASMRAAFLVKCGAGGIMIHALHHLACCRGRMGLVHNAMISSSVTSVRFCIFHCSPAGTTSNESPDIL
jgi:hypothetical protein